MKKSLILSLVVAMLCTVMSCKKPDSVLSNTLIGNFQRTVNGVTITYYVTDATHFSYTEASGGVILGTVTGSYTSTGNEVEFTETSSNSGCVNVVGKYSYAVTTTNVTFVLISDACTGGLGARSNVVVGVWTRI